MTEDKILTGYMYRSTPIPEENRDPNERYVSLHTGAGGAKLLLEAFREKGMPDSFAETQIQVLTDTHGWVALADLTVKKIEKPNGE